MMLYSTIRAAAVIDEYIPKDEYRRILKLRLCQKMPYEQIGETVGYSTQWCKQIVWKYQAEILALL